MNKLSWEEIKGIIDAEKEVLYEMSYDARKEKKYDNLEELNSKLETLEEVQHVFWVVTHKIKH